MRTLSLFCGVVSLIVGLVLAICLIAPWFNEITTNIFLASAGWFALQKKESEIGSHVFDGPRLLWLRKLCCSDERTAGAFVLFAALAGFFVTYAHYQEGKQNEKPAHSAAPDHSSVERVNSSE